MLPPSVTACEIATCVPEEMRFLDLNSAFESLGFRNMNNFDNIADLVAHVCAGTAQVICIVVDQDEQSVASQTDFIRLISNRIMIIRMMDNLPEQRNDIDGLTDDDYLLDFNDLDSSLEQLLPVFKEKAIAVDLFNKWIKDGIVSTPADVARISKVTHIKADAITKNADALNVQGPFIGRGATGDVFQCNCTLLSKPMACKNIDTKKLSPQLIKTLERELATMTKLGPHPHVIRFFFRAINQQDPENRKIYMELCKTTVQTLLKGSGKIPIEVAKGIMLHLLKALEFLHFNNVIHRDVKPDNLLVAYDGVYKLADLGSSIEADPKTKLVTEKSDLAGTLKYMAPEVFNGQHYGTSADIWSAGVLLLEFLGELPRDGAAGPGGVDVLPSFFNPDKPDDVSAVPLPLTLEKNLSNFLVMCLQRDASKRATPTQLLQTPFLKGANPSAKNVSQFVGQSMKAGAGGASTVMPSLQNMVNKAASISNLANSCSHSDVLSFLMKK